MKVSTCSFERVVQSKFELPLIAQLNAAFRLIFFMFKDFKKIIRSSICFIKNQEVFDAIEEAEGKMDGQTIEYPLKLEQITRVFKIDD